MKDKFRFLQDVAVTGTLAIKFTVYADTVSTSAATLTLTQAHSIFILLLKYHTVAPPFPPRKALIGLLILSPTECDSNQMIFRGESFLE